MLKAREGLHLLEELNKQRQKTWANTFLYKWVLHQ